MRTITLDFKLYFALRTRCYRGTLLHFVSFQVANNEDSPNSFYQKMVCQNANPGPTLSYLDVPQKKFVMACYTVSLTCNETINAKQ